MFIYKWPADKENDTGIVGQHSSCDVRGESPPSTGCTPTWMLTRRTASGALSCLSLCGRAPLLLLLRACPTQELQETWKQREARAPWELQALPLCKGSWVAVEGWGHAWPETGLYSPDGAKGALRSWWAPLAGLVGGQA